MATRRRFSNAFKRMVVEEYLSGSITQAQLARRYTISPQLIIRWRQLYSQGTLARDNDADMLSRDARIRELERMVGKLTMENELLKKAAHYEQQKRNEHSFIITGPNVVPYKRGAL